MRISSTLAFLLAACTSPSDARAAPPALETSTVFDVDDVLWGFDFLPDGSVLYTLRTKGLHRFVGGRHTKVDGAPGHYARGQGGMMDVAYREISGKPYVYLTYVAQTPEGSRTTLGRGQWRDNRLVDFEVLWRSNANVGGGFHFGSRMVFDSAGYLFFTHGDRGERLKSQSLGTHHGTVLRLKVDGTVPKDNPFVGRKGAQPDIWSYGHRNPQGIDLALDGSLWSCEFGPRGGDELNLIGRGKNYGWPVITYGREYSGPKIGTTHKKGMEQPVAHWVPSISPSGMVFYRGDAIPQWKGDLFLANLSSTHLRRLRIENNRVTEQEVLLEDLNERIRHVRNGPGGKLYVSTDSGILFALQAK